MIYNPETAGGGGTVETVNVTLQPSMLGYSAWCIYVNGEELISQQHGGGSSFQMNKNSLLYLDNTTPVTVVGACERVSINPTGLQTETTNCYFVYGDITIEP